jgi:hypothetical protein
MIGRRARLAYAPMVARHEIGHASDHVQYGPGEAPVTRGDTRLPRRAFLQAVAGSGLAAPRLTAKPRPEYLVALRPRRALIGEQIVAVLSCGVRDVAVVADFDDASLTLEMRRVPSDSDPERSFPNHFAAQQGTRLVRYSRQSRRTLRPGQRLERTFDLLAVFPERALDVGDFEISYEIGHASRRVGPARLTIESGPGAVPGLLDVLAKEDAGVRERAAGLLHKMTAHVVGYSAASDPSERRGAIDRWRGWWEKTGSGLPWNFLVGRGNVWRRNPDSTFRQAQQGPRRCRLSEASARSRRCACSWLRVGAMAASSHCGVSDASRSRVDLRSDNPLSAG